MYHNVTLCVSYCYISYFYNELVYAELWKEQYVEES